LSIPYWLLAILGSALSVGTIGTILLWGSVWIRVEHWMRVVPTLRLGQALAAADPPNGRVCVVVPAYNEAGVIAALIRSLRAETYPQLRVVLALDRCRDDTASLARAGIVGDERFEVIEVDACPADWAAKVHAVNAGVTRSRGAADADYLLFADADTVFTPGCIAATVAMMRHGKLDMLSLLSTLTHDTWFERVVQTAAVFELMRQYPLTLANALKDRRPFANGQFMLFTRDAYAAVGGHGAVKDALLEDLALVRLIDASGRKSGVFLAAGLFHCRMYADWAEFRRGWKRIYIEAANRRPRRLSHSARWIRWLGTILPAWMLTAGALAPMVIAGDSSMGWTLLSLWPVALLLWLGALLRISTLSRAPRWTAPLHIVGAWLTANLLSEAARDVRLREPTRWGGREYFRREKA
jgi:cellulose synthase/poly-beta-1,6-N-acetylglucosamine synthase-like glycosyltransferase